MSAKTFEVGEDEEGMRLDRWFKRRMPTLALSHLNKIVRTGEVRVDGARVKPETRRHPIGRSTSVRASRHPGRRRATTLGTGSRA